MATRGPHSEVGFTLSETLTMARALPTGICASRRSACFSTLRSSPLPNSFRGGNRFYLRREAIATGQVTTNLIRPEKKIDLPRESPTLLIFAPVSPLWGGCVKSALQARVSREAVCRGLPRSIHYRVERRSTGRLHRHTRPRLASWSRDADMSGCSTPWTQVVTKRIE